METQNIKPGLMVHAKSQGQMSGAQGSHVGTVDHLDGGKYIKLKRTDSTDGNHHWIPVAWVEKADDRAIYLNKTEEQFRDGLYDSLPGAAEGEANYSRPKRAI